ncbi:Crp/Fnr family transcriptional regulator [Cohnella sp. JJ-181]|uniref:Crp/Fnr family transcriptional regulator n=1 Tax=Cohnella rhizoplanae TaxID=2974897 RepID=UPI0022FF9F7A|nr:Crp/Fnr family transcriptional regulator [Cohnella sp. JJ-181]CAI6017187.1 Cyclic AMP receptor-like protein [Cohnella sp. JJ-181]
MPITATKLRSIPFFKGIDPALFDRVLPYVQEKVYRKGSMIFLEGSEGDEIYFILSGSVSIHTINKSKKVVLAFFHEGDYFGEMALIKPGLVRSATAETASQTRLLSLRRSHFQLLFENDRNLLHYLVEDTMNRLRKANQQIYDLTFLSVRSRIIKRLTSWCEEYGGASDPSAPVRIPIKLTHQQLADMVGAVRETVSKVLQDMQDEDLIQIQQKMIQVKDRARLEKLLVNEM